MAVQLTAAVLIKEDYPHLAYQLHNPRARWCKMVGVVCKMVGVVCKMVGVVCKMVGVVCKMVGVVCKMVGVVRKMVGVVRKMVGVVCKMVGVVCKMVGVVWSSLICSLYDNVLNLIPMLRTTFHVLNFTPCSGPYSHEDNISCRLDLFYVLDELTLSSETLIPCPGLHSMYRTLLHVLDLIPCW